MVDADLPIDESSLSLHEVREVVTNLRGTKALFIYNISAEVFKVGAEVINNTVPCSQDYQLAVSYHS